MCWWSNESKELFGARFLTISCSVCSLRKSRTLRELQLSKHSSFSASPRDFSFRAFRFSWLSLPSIQDETFLQKSNNKELVALVSNHIAFVKNNWESNAWGENGLWVAVFWAYGPLVYSMSIFRTWMLHYNYINSTGIRLFFLTAGNALFALLHSLQKASETDFRKSYLYLFFLSFFTHFIYCIIRGRKREIQIGLVYRISILATVLLQFGICVPSRTKH